MHENHNGINRSLSQGTWNLQPSAMKRETADSDLVSRAVEIPCPACPTWSHFIQDKLKISLYLSLNKCKICIKFINFEFDILINHYEFTCCIENSVDPDQLASSEAS